MWTECNATFEIHSRRPALLRSPFPKQQETTEKRLNKILQQNLFDMLEKL